MFLNRAAALKLLRRQDWSSPPSLPRRRPSALSMRGRAEPAAAPEPAKARAKG